MDCLNNGLESGCRVHVKKLEKYCGWRDPDLVNQRRKKSIPNRMKRFLVELSGEPRKKSSNQFKQELSNSNTPSDTVSSLVLPQITEIDQGDVMETMKLIDICKSSKYRCALRCALCDYPYDPTKRRKPPVYADDCPSSENGRPRKARFGQIRHCWLLEYCRSREEEDHEIEEEAKLFGALCGFSLHLHHVIELLRTSLIQSYSVGIIGMEESQEYADCFQLNISSNMGK